MEGPGLRLSEGHDNRKVHRSNKLKLVDTNDVKKETDEPSPVPEEKIKPSQRPGYAPIKSEYVYILKSFIWIKKLNL